MANPEQYSSAEFGQMHQGKSLRRLHMEAQVKAQMSAHATEAASFKPKAFQALMDVHAAMMAEKDPVRLKALRTRITRLPPAR